MANADLNGTNISKKSLDFNSGVNISTVVIAPNRHLNQPALEAPAGFEITHAQLLRTASYV